MQISQTLLFNMFCFSSEPKKNTNRWVMSSRVWEKLLKGAMCSFSGLSVILIILMWVGISSCWARGGGRRSLKSGLKYTHGITHSILKTHGVTNLCTCTHITAFSHGTILRHTDSHLGVYTQTHVTDTDMQTAVNQAKINVGHCGFNCSVVCLLCWNHHQREYARREAHACNLCASKLACARWSTAVLDVVYMTDLLGPTNKILLQK